MKNKILCLCLALTMLFGMMSGMSLTAFADEEVTDSTETTTVNSTDEFLAINKSDSSGVGEQPNMFFPNQTDTAETGISYLQDGNWVSYDDITFSGKEMKLSVDYATTGSYGTLNVYLDEINEDNLIASSTKLIGGDWGWPTVKTQEIAMMKQVESGEHKVIFEGGAVLAKDDGSYQNGVKIAAIRSFKFVEGDWSTVKKSTVETIASECSERSEKTGTEANMFFPNQTDTGATGISYLQDGNWVSYKDVYFSGSEMKLAVDYATTGSYGTLNIYLDEKDDNHLIASSNKLVGGDWGWSTVKTQEIAMLKPVKAGPHTIIIEGGDVLEKAEGGYQNGVRIGAIRSFKFVEGDWSTVKKSTDETIASECSERSEKTGTEANMFFPNQTDTGATGISYLQDGNWVSYKDVYFSGSEVKLSVDYATTGSYGGLNIYIDEKDSDHLIASSSTLVGGDWGWATVKTQAIRMLKSVKAGPHTIIIEGGDVLEKAEGGYQNGVRIGAIRSFKFVEGKAATQTFIALNEYANAGAPENDGWASSVWTQDMNWNNVTVYAVNGFRNNRWLKYDDILFAGNETEFSGVFMYVDNVTDLNFNVYIDEISEENLIAQGVDLSVGSGWGGPKTVTVPLEHAVEGTHSVIIEGTSDPADYEETWGNDLFAFYSFNFVEGEWPETSISDPVVKLNGTDVDWANAFSAAGTYTVSVDVAYAPETAKLYVAVYSANKKLIAAQGSATTGNGAQSVELVIPEGTDLNGATAKAFVWTTDTMEPLAKF